MRDIIIALAHEQNQQTKANRIVESDRICPPPPHKHTHNKNEKEREKQHVITVNRCDKNRCISAPYRTYTHAHIGGECAREGHAQIAMIRFLEHFFVVTHTHTHGFIHQS